MFPTERKKKITGVEMAEAKRIFAEMNKDRLIKCLNISQRDYHILLLRLLEKRRHREIAGYYKLSEERVRQICTNAIIAMKGCSSG